MKALLIASLVAVASATAFIAPASAASVIIGPDGAYVDQDNYGDYYHRHRHYDDNAQYDDNVQYDGYDNGYRRYHHRHHCHLEQVVHWRHHHRVVEDVRVCG